MQKDNQQTPNQLMLAEQRLIATPHGNNIDITQYQPDSEQSSQDDLVNQQEEDDYQQINKGHKQRIQDKFEKAVQQQDSAQKQFLITQRKQQEIQQKSQQMEKQDQQDKNQQKQESFWDDVPERDKQQPIINYKQQQQEQFQVYNHLADSKYIYAVYLLFMNQIKQFVPKNKAFIRCNPKINNKSIKIGYKDKKTLQQIQNKLEDFIDSIEVLEVPKRQAEGGVLHSQKYRNFLKKQNIAIFIDPNNRYKTQNTYICGKVPKKQLMTKINQIKKTNFTWLHLFKYPNTRSYRKILRVIFDQPDIKQLVLKKFNAKQIQVRMFYDQNQQNLKYRKNGVSIILTIHGQKKLTIHQEIQESITKFIKDTYYIFCFAFIRDKLSQYKKYVPNFDKAIMFYINQKHICLTYLLVIVKQQNYKQLKTEIIKQVKSLNLGIKGLRFFRNLYPTLPERIPNGYRIEKYPRDFAYSWTVYGEKDKNFLMEDFMP